MFAGSKLEADVEGSLSNVRRALDGRAGVVGDVAVCSRALESGRLIGESERGMLGWVYDQRTDLE